MRACAENNSVNVSPKINLNNPPDQADNNISTFHGASDEFAEYVDDNHLFDNVPLFSDDEQDNIDESIPLARKNTADPEDDMKKLDYRFNASNYTLTYSLD